MLRIALCVSSVPVTAIIVGLATNFIVALGFYVLTKRDNKREVQEQAQATKWLSVFFVGLLCAAVLVICRCKLSPSA
jgi:hypothetical protein